MNRYATVIDPSHESARMRHFHALDRQQQAQAIGRLAIAGQGEHSIAHATGLSVEFIRRVLAEFANAREPSRALTETSPRQSGDMDKTGGDAHA